MSHAFPLSRSFTLLKPFALLLMLQSYFAGRRTSHSAGTGKPLSFFLSLFPSFLSPHYHTASMLTVQQGRSLSMPGIYTRGTPARPRHGSSSGSPLKFPSVRASFHQSLDPFIASSSVPPSTVSLTCSLPDIPHRCRRCRPMWTLPVCAWTMITAARAPLAAASTRPPPSKTHTSSASRAARTSLARRRFQSRRRGPASCPRPVLGPRAGPDAAAAQKVAGHPTRRRLERLRAQTNWASRAC